jgi:dipeptidyl aminopeptidase/acylaminoacyl peptidase
MSISEKYESNGQPSLPRPDLKPPAGWSLPFISSLDLVRNHSLSPDGRQIAFIWDRDDRSELYLMPASGGWPQRLSCGRGPTITWDDELPAWSPDGQWLAFTQGDHVYVVPVSGSLPRKISDFTTSANAPAWMPDSCELVISVTRGEANQLLLTDREGHWPRPLVEDPKGNASDPRPSPDGHWVAYVFQPFADLRRLDIRLVEVANGQSHSLTSLPALFNHSPRWRPGGQLLAYLTQQSGFNELWLVQPDGSNQRQLTHMGCDLSDPAWSPDGTRLACIANRGGAFELVLVDAQSGQSKTLVGGKGIYARPNWSPDGSWLTVEHEGPSQPPDICSIDLATRRIESLAHSLPPALQNVHWIQPEVVMVESCEGLSANLGGAPSPAIPAMLYRPERSNRAGILYLHGGPNDQVGYQWDIFKQYLSAAGYTIFCPNYRGSTGYGLAYERANYLDWGGGDLQDCLAAGDFLARQPGVDAKRLGCWGPSYGGYLTNCALARDPLYRFACGVSVFGDANLLTSWAQCSQRLRLYTEIYLGHPAEQRQVYQAGSPIHQVAAVKAPLLLLHGLLDDIVPPESSEEWAQALRQAGKTFEYKTYTNEPHGLLHRVNRLDAWQRIERFFNWYLLPRDIKDV